MCDEQQGGHEEVAVLPWETWECVLSFLVSARDLCTVACVSSQFAALVRESKRLWRGLALGRRWPSRQAEAPAWDRGAFQCELFRRVRLGHNPTGPRTLPIESFEGSEELSFQTETIGKNSLLQRLRSGSLQSIVQLIVHQEANLVQCNHTFNAVLYNYHPQYSHAQFIEALLNAMPLYWDQDYKLMWRRKIKTSRLFRLLLRWIELYPDLVYPTDIYTPETALDLLRSYLNNYVGPLSTEDIELLLSALGAEMGRLRSNHPQRPNTTAEPVEDASYHEEIVISALQHFLEASPRDLAVQLTSYDRDLFLRLGASEFKNCGWMKKDKLQTSTHILQLIKQFNKVASMVTFSVLIGRPKINDAPQDRAVMIQHWIKIAQELKELGNLNGLMAVMSGLNSSSIFRLKSTRHAVTNEYADLWRELEGLASCDRGFMRLRQAMQGSCLPYLGIMLTDVTYILDGQGSCAHPVNFRRWSYIRDIFDELRRCREAVRQWELSPPPQAAQILTTLLAYRTMEEEELFAASLQAEPRATTSAVGQDVPSKSA